MPPPTHTLLLPPSPSSLRLKPLSQPLQTLTPRRHVRCAVSLAESSSAVQARPPPAEVCRTITELSYTGTLSSVTPDGWPLGIGARFVVDSRGAPALCLSSLADAGVEVGSRSSFHVQLEQSGSRTPQCTLLGSLSKPEDTLVIKKLHANWEKKFGENLDTNLLYTISVERVLHLEDFKENGVWVTPLDYLNADPDPLRNFAEKIVDEMNDKHSEDVRRLCNVHVDPDFQVLETKMIWVDKLGFDLHIHSQEGIFEARIPFPRQVSDEKAVKSSFNCMTHLAWEVEKTYAAAEFEKVRSLKRIR